MSSKKTTAAKPAAPAPAEVPQKEYTDKTYEQLPLHAEVVVQVGPRIRMQKNKPVVVEEARNVIFTKAGFDMMDRDDEGDTTHCLTQLLGIPRYKTVEDPTIPDGKRTEFEVLYFRESDEEAEEEEPAA